MIKFWLLLPLLFALYIVRKSAIMRVNKNTLYYRFSKEKAG